MSLLLEDKTAVIYAAGGAIGGAVARAFAREGARLLLTGRDLAKVNAVAEEIVASGGVAETARVDVLDESAVAAHLDTVVEQAGGIDISFNAVGPGPAPERLPLTELGVDAFARPIAFYTRSSGVPVQHRVESAGEVAAIYRQRPDATTGILLTAPIPAEAELDAALLDGVIADALASCAAAGVRGAAVTPYLLEHLEAATGGTSVRANLALAEHNASVAARVAAAVAAS